MSSMHRYADLPQFSMREIDCFIECLCIKLLFTQLFSFSLFVYCCTIFI